MANTVERVHYREKAERVDGKARVGVPGDIDAWGHKRRLTLDRFSGPAKVRPEAVQLRVIRVVLALARGLDIVSVARKVSNPKAGRYRSSYSIRSGL
jgi:hypothetical protein